MVNHGVSVIIPTHFRSERLAELLSQFQNLIKNEKVEYEIVVVTNLNDPNLQIVVNRFSKILPIKLFSANRVGINSARNVGICNAKYDICFFIDDDCRLFDLTWYHELVDTFAECDAAAVGGLLVPFGKMSVPGLAYYVSILTWLYRYSKPRTNLTRRLVGGCLAISRNRILDLKFDENIVFGGDENSLILKLVRRDEKVVLNKKIKIGHDFNVSALEIIKKSYLFGRYHFYHMTAEEHLPFSEQKRNYQEIEKILLKRLAPSPARRFFVKVALRLRKISFNLPLIFRRPS